MENWFLIQRFCLSWNPHHWTTQFPVSAAVHLGDVPGCNCQEMRVYCWVSFASACRHWCGWLCRLSAGRLLIEEKN